MLLRRLSAVPVVTLMALVIVGNTAFAQLFPFGGLMPRPMYAGMTNCYQTVPVTSMVESREKVQVGTWQTVQEEREYTVMAPKTEYREVEITEVNYQTVVENQQVTRDTGRWITQYHPVARYSPCQVDPRPGVIGWMNRTGYTMRTAFMPNYTTSRQYVPNVTTFNVPVTRQVAVPTKRVVRVPETRMVAEKRVEQIPVRKLVFEEQERMVARPQTVWQQVPMGSATAFNSYGYSPQVAYVRPLSGSQTAARPQQDPVSTRSTLNTGNSGSSKAFQRTAEETPGIQVNPSSFQRDLPATNEVPEFSFPQGRREDPTGSEQSSGLTSQRQPGNSGWRATRATRLSSTVTNTDRPVSVLTAVTTE